MTRGRPDALHVEIRAFALRELASGIRRGLDPARAAKDAAARAPRGGREPLVRLSAALAEGHALDAAMARDPELWPPHTRALVATAQRGPGLADTLAELADAEARAYGDRRRLVALERTFAVYAGLYTVALAVVALMVRPLVADHLALNRSWRYGRREVLERGIDFLVLDLPVPLLVVVSTGLLVWILGRTAGFGPGRSAHAESWLGRLPGSRGVIDRLERSRWLAVFATGMRAGLDARAALAFTKEGVVTRRFRARLERAQALVEAGRSLARASRECALLPPLEVPVLAAAELRDDLAATALRLSADHRTRFLEEVGLASRLALPALTLCVAIPTLYLAFVYMWPMLDLLGIFGRYSW